MGQNFGTTAAQLGGNAVGLLGLLESVKHGGILNALQQRQALQQDPAYRASLIGSPFAAGVNFIGGENQMPQQPLPDGITGPPQPQGPAVFVPHFGGPLAAGPELKDTSAQQQLEALRDPNTYLNRIITGVQSAAPNSRLTVRGKPGMVPEYAIAPPAASDIQPGEIVQTNPENGQTLVMRPDGTVRRVIPGNPVLQGVNIGVGTQRLRGAEGGAAAAADVRARATGGGVPPTSQAPPQAPSQAPPPLQAVPAPTPTVPQAAPAPAPADPNAIPPQFYVPNTGGGYPSPAAGAQPPSVSTSTTTTAAPTPTPTLAPTPAPAPLTFRGTNISQGARGTTVTEKYVNEPAELAQEAEKKRLGGVSETGIQSIGSQLSTDDALTALSHVAPAEIDRLVGPQTASGFRGYKQYVSPDAGFANFNSLIGQVGLLGFTIGGKQLTEGEKESLEAVIPNLQTASPVDFRTAMKRTANMLRHFAVARLQNEGAKLNPNTAKLLAGDIARLAEIEAKFSEGGTPGHPDILSGGMEQ